MGRKIAISYVFTNRDRTVVFKISILVTGIIVPQTIGQNYLGVLLPRAGTVVTEVIILSGISRTHGTISHFLSINGQ